MGAGDGGDDCDARGCEQDAVGPREASQKRGWVARRKGGETPVSERLGNEDDRHEQRPDENHGVHPPERGVRETLPQLETPHHPQAGRAGKRDRPADLTAKRFSIASNSAQALRGSLCARASGRATNVTKPTPPIQCATKSTCSARASSMSSIIFDPMMTALPRVLPAPYRCPHLSHGSSSVSRAGVRSTSCDSCNPFKTRRASSCNDL